MRDMTNTLNLEPFSELLNTKINPQTLADILDDVLFEYAHGNLLRPSEIGKSAPNNLHWIRELRDVVKSSCN